MSKLMWAQTSERFYETGLDRGVLYLADGSAVPWNGLTGFDEDFGDDNTTPYFVDGVKYLDSQSTGDFAATLKAFTYPDEFLDCEGVESISNGLYIDDQAPKPFGLSYRTRIGNDVNSELGYKLHICYNLLAVQDDVTYQTATDTFAPNEFSWKITSVPEDAPGYRPTAHIVLDSRYMYTRLLPDLEDILYGTDQNEPRLPPLSELMQIVPNWRLITIVDNNDGTWTATGPDDLVILHDDQTFTIKYADAYYIDNDTYVIQDSVEPLGGWYGNS